MLVAAGLGSRLDPLTRELPKPALPLGNRPVAWFALDHLQRCGVRDVVVNTHHLAERLRAQLEPHCPADVQLRFVHEPEILGTGGGVRNAWRPIAGEDFLVFNAKLLFAPDLARAVAVHRASGAIATLVLRRMPAGEAFAAVEIDGDGRVRRIRREPRNHAPGAELRMFTGVQILSASAHRDLPESGDVFEHAYIPWLARGEHIASVTDDATWLDVGVSPRHYLEANLALARGEVHWPGMAADVRGVIAADASIDPNAQVTHSVIGSRVHVSGGAALERVVAWDDARIAGSIRDAVITTRGQVVHAQGA
jgi:mannose-1-phosphate guanylyltransferase